MLAPTLAFQQNGPLDYDPRQVYGQNSHKNVVEDHLGRAELMLQLWKKQSRPALKLHRPQEAAISPVAESSVAKASQLRQRRILQAWVGTVCLVALGVAALKIDLPFALYFLQERCPKIVREFVELFEAFSHAFGVLTILVSIYWLDPKSRPYLARIGTAAIVAGLAANCGKMLISRTRPKYFDFVGGVEATFGEWFPFLGAGTNGQGFPSAHAATAFGLAVALGWRYPQGRWLFAFMASMAGLQRVAGYAHFASDSIWGAAIGFLVGQSFLLWRPLAMRFERLESALMRKASQQMEESGEETDNERSHRRAA